MAMRLRRFLRAIRAGLKVALASEIALRLARGLNNCSLLLTYSAILREIWRGDLRSALTGRRSLGGAVAALVHRVAVVAAHPAPIDPEVCGDRIEDCP